MVTDYLMYQVKKIWYHLYWAYMVCCCLVLIGLSILTKELGGQLPYFTDLGLTTTTLVLTGLCLTYLISGYWLVVRRSPGLGVMAGSLLFALAILSSMAEAAPGNSTVFYGIIWAGTAFFSGMFGLPILLSFAFLTYFAVMAEHTFKLSQMGLASWGFLLTYMAIAGGAYIFWRGKYMSTQDQTVSKLSGALRSNQQQSEILIQSLSDGVIVVNTEGHISLINPAAAQLTGWEVSEALGIDVQLVMKLTQENGKEITPDEDPFALILSQQKPTSQTLQLTSRDGKSKRVVSLVLSPVLLPKTTNFMGAVAIVRDVSDERAAEKQRAEFISTASHEMRTPVAAIEGYLALALSDKVSTIDSRARSYLEKAHSSTQHLGKLFQDLLTSSKAEDGRLSNHPVVVEMGAFMQQLSDDLRFAAEKKGLLAEFIVGASDAAVDATAHDASQAHMVKPLYYVHADPDRMREVITNLFDNACKYTEQGKIAIGLTGDNDVVQVYIRDTGSGIPPDDIPHLFQKFYRVDNSATRTIGGTGLGLFICRKIVEMYRGRIWAESTLGKGSTFFVNLPRITTAHATELQAKEAATTAQPGNT